jgi:peptidoglycan/LPS O-acetylase OafA/YrhL
MRQPVRGMSAGMRQPARGTGTGTGQPVRGVGTGMHQPVRGGNTSVATPTTAAPREPWLTRLRAGLIGWVVLYHLDLTLGVSAALPWTAPVLRKGYLGVDGFFLLSGFALWLGYAARPPWGARGIGDFLARRVAKIWPLHLAALAALVALVGLAAAAGATIRDPERFSVEQLLLQLLLVNAWETTDRLDWNYPSWALSVEWAGYLAFPLLLRGALALPRAAVPLAAAAALGGLLALSWHQPGTGLNWTYHLGLVRFGLGFVLGLALGRLATEGRLPGRSAGLLLALSLGLLAVGLALREDAVAVAGLAAALAGLWRLGRERPAGAGGAAAVARRQDLLLRLGEASFGVYLCWIFVELALIALLRAAGDPGLGARLALMSGALALNLALGWLAWRWVEVPAQRWILGRWRAAGGAVATQTG